MVTVDPIPVVSGENWDIVGVVLKMNPFLEDVPPEPWTITFPEAPAPTTAVMVDADCTLNEVAGMPPKLTVSTPEKLVPLMVTVAPGPPVTGVKEVMFGAGIKVNPPTDAVDEPVDTDTFPVAPGPG